MSDEDRSFYAAIIVACILGIVIIAYTITTSPKYEENFTELYFYGEKIGLSDGMGQIGNYEIMIDGEGIFFSKDGTSYGPYQNGSTIQLDGEYWYIEDISEDEDQMMLRKIPLSATQSSEINGTYIISNHKNSALDYTVTIASIDNANEENVTVGDGSKVELDFTLALPSIGEAPSEKTGEYQEEFESYTRIVEDYGDFKKITLVGGDNVLDQYWRVKVSISLNTGEEIHFWIKLNDE